MKYLKYFDKSKSVLIVSIFVALIALIGTSYALLKTSYRGNNTYTMNIGNLEISFQDNNTNSLTLTNMYPMTDEEGMETNDALEFTIQNTGDFNAVYSVYLDETSTNPSFKNVIKYSVNKNNTGYGEALSVTNNMLYIDSNQILNTSATANYKVKVWLSEDASDTYMNKTFTARVIVETGQIVTINFNANEGVVSPTSKTVAASSTTYGALPVPTREGYEFTGWYTALENGTEVTENTPFTYGTSPQTLYAIWEAAAVPVPTLSEMCPGCVFAYDTDWVYGTNGTTLNSSQYYTDYREVVGPFTIGDDEHPRVFLGLILNNNKISRAFVCAENNSDPLVACVEGTTDGSKYHQNIEFMKRFPSVYGDCDNGECYVHDDNYHWLADFSISSNGTVNAQNMDYMCWVYNTGDIECLMD